MNLKKLMVCAAVLTLSPLAWAAPKPSGWMTKGPRDNREHVHRATGLSCSTELLPMMDLKAFGAAKSNAPGKPFCEYERSGDTVRVFILGRSPSDAVAMKTMLKAAREGSYAQMGFPVNQNIDVVSSDSKIRWTGVAFDTSKGKSSTHDVASISFASINGWDVRLDINYKISNVDDPGPKSQEPELRDAMTYLLAATLKRPK